MIKKIKLEENRFGFEPEVTAKIARIPNIRIYEVGISYYGRTYAEGKKITTIEGLSEKGDHPVQQAWIEHDVPQCGYCQAGQIMTAAATLPVGPDRIACCTAGS